MSMLLALGGYVIRGNASAGVRAPGRKPDVSQVQGLPCQPVSAPKYAFFTKHLEWLGYDELATVLQEAGFAAADLTVREGGHVEPPKAATDLPRARRALAARGLSLPLVVTRITDPAAPGTEDLLRVLADNGVRHYRMGYLRYADDRPPETQLTGFRATFERLAELNARYGLCANYQNHAGTNFGASLWDLAEVLDGLDHRYVGCQFDVRHAVYEGGESWRTDLRRIAPAVTTTVVKDFHWVNDPERGWRHRNVPLGEGMVPVADFYALCAQLAPEAPISLHSEYPLLTPDEERLPAKQKMKLAVEHLRRDVTTLRSMTNP